MGEEEVLGPTPPEHHHHISQDVRHKVDVLNWLASNRDDPALKVRNKLVGQLFIILTGETLEFSTKSKRSSSKPFS